MMRDSSQWLGARDGRPHFAKRTSCMGNKFVAGLGSLSPQRPLTERATTPQEKRSIRNVVYPTVWAVNQATSTSPSRRGNSPAMHSSVENVRNLRNLRKLTGFLTFLTSKSFKNPRFLTFLTFLSKFRKRLPVHSFRAFSRQLSFLDSRSFAFIRGCSSTASSPIRKHTRTHSNTLNHPKTHLT